MLLRLAEVTGVRSPRWKCQPQEERGGISNIASSSHPTQESINLIFSEIRARDDNPQQDRAIAASIRRLPMRGKTKREL